MKKQSSSRHKGNPRSTLFDVPRKKCGSRWDEKIEEIIENVFHDNNRVELLDSRIDVERRVAIG